MSDISDLLAPLINRAGGPVPLEDLEREVHRRRRVRRVVAGVSVVAVVTAATLIAVSLTGGSPKYVSVAEPPALKSVALPPGQLMQDISVMKGRLLLTGQSSTTDSRVCTAMSVDPATLTFGRVRHGSCNNPSLSGQQVGISVAQGTSIGFDSTARVVTADPATGKVSAGPVLFSYADGSDTRPLWVYGGSWLWVYDVDTEHGPEVVQVSATTGQVQATIPIPKLFRPILAADDDGLWVGESIEGSGEGLDTLYRVAPGASDATTVIAGDQVVRWLVATGHHVWVGTTPPGSLTQEIWRFDGTSGTPVFRVAEAGFDPTNVIGDETDGLWTMQWDPPFSSGIPQGSRAQQIIRIDPDTGAEQVIATLPAVAVPPGEGGYGLLSGQAAVLDGAVYLLEPPFRTNGYQGYSTLVRVPVETAGSSQAETPPASISTVGLGAFTPASTTTWWALIRSNNGPFDWIARTSDSGRHWSNVLAPPQGIASQYFLNRSTAWAATGTEAPSGAGTFPLYRTIDGGSTWRQVGTLPEGACTLQFVDQTQGWCTDIGAAAGSEGVRLYRTNDGGTTWRLVSVTSPGVGPPSTPNALPFGCDKTISFTSPQVGWAAGYCNGGSAYLERSSDGGADWEPLGRVPLPAGYPTDQGEGYEIPVQNGSDLAMTVRAGNRKFVATSTDNGSTWQDHQIPGGPGYWNVDLIDPNHWALTNGTTLAITADAGAHWAISTPNIPLSRIGSGMIPDQLSFLTPTQGWAIPAPDGGPPLWTTDAGATWVKVQIAAGPYALSG